MCLMSVILTLGKLRWANHQRFEASLSCLIDTYQVRVQSETLISIKNTTTQAWRDSPAVKDVCCFPEDQSSVPSNDVGVLGVMYASDFGTFQSFATMEMDVITIFLN